MIEDYSYEINSYNLDLSIDKQKIRVQAIHHQTNDRYICEVYNSNMPIHMTSIFQDYTQLFDNLLLMAKHKELRIAEDGKLMIPYKIESKGRSVKKEFVLDMNKLELNEFDSLRKKVKLLQDQQKSAKKEINTLKQQHKIFKEQIKFLQMISDYYHFNPGVYKSLLNINPQAIKPQYRLRGNYLFKQIASQQQKRRQKHMRGHSNTIIQKFAVIDEPINNFEDKIFSYQITLQSGQYMFIGLCCLKQKNVGNVFSNQENTVEAFQFVTPKWVQNNKLFNPLSFRQKKRNNCKLFYKEDQKDSIYVFGKGATLTMTVDMNEFHMTWFVNRICVQRTFFQEPTSNLYPFIKLSQNTEVLLHQA